MSGDISNSSGAERDLLCRGLSGFLLWCAPWLVFVLGFSTPPGFRTALWTTSFVVMGAACLLNAARCGRVHCWFTGPFFILAAHYLPSLWPRASAARTVRVEVDRRRDNHWCLGPLLYS